MSWSVLQSAGTASDSSGALKVTYSSNLSSGTKLIAVVVGYEHDISSVKDAAGNSFTALSSVSLNGDGQLGLYAIDTPSGDVGTKPQITVTFATNSGGNAVVIQEVSGLATGNTLAEMIDGTPATKDGNVSSNSTVSCASYSTTAVDEYLVALYGDDQNSETHTTGVTGSTTYTVDSNSQQANDIMADIVAYGNSTNGAETAGFAMTGVSGTSQYGTIFCAFLLASGGGSESGPFAITLPPLAAGLAGSVTESGPLAAVLPALSVSLTGNVTESGPLSIALPSSKVTLAGLVTESGPLAITLPKPVVSLAGHVSETGPLAITLPSPAVSLAGSVSGNVTSAFAIDLPAPRASLAGVLDHDGPFAPVLPAPETSTSMRPANSRSRCRRWRYR